MHYFAKRDVNKPRRCAISLTQRHGLCFIARFNPLPVNIVVLLIVFDRLDAHIVVVFHREAVFDNGGFFAGCVRL